MGTQGRGLHTYRWLESHRINGPDQTSVAQGTGRKQYICSEIHEKGARLASEEEPSSQLWAAEVIWSCKSSILTVQPGKSFFPDPHLLTLPVPRHFSLFLSNLVTLNLQCQVFYLQVGAILITVLR